LTINNNKRKNFGGLQANRSLKTAGLRRIQNGTLTDKSSKYDLPIDKITFKYI